MPVLGIIASSKVGIPPNSYESIATTTVGVGGSSSITFTSIPQTYKHLQIRAIAQQVTGGFVSVTLDNATFVYRHYLLGNGSTLSSGADTTNAPGIFSTNAVNGASIFGASVLDILDYTSTNKNKTFRSIGGSDSNGSGSILFLSALFTSSSTVTSITLTANTSVFTQYSQFALYGIKGA